MLGEIQAAKDAQTKIEDEILNVMEAIETADKDYKSNEQKFKSDEGLIKSQIQELEKQKADFEAQAAKKKEERAAFTPSISADSLHQYESIRSRRGGVAIVPLIANSCGGCRMNMTPNQLIEIKKGKNVVYCNNCTRIIYVPASDPSSAPPQQPSIPAA
jgi:predicted  nucleic acid-binding Zn-ribbon protein